LRSPTGFVFAKKTQGIGVSKRIPHCAAMIGHPDGMAAHEKCFRDFGKEEKSKVKEKEEKIVPPLMSFVGTRLGQR